MGFEPMHPFEPTDFRDRSLSTRPTFRKKNHFSKTTEEGTGFEPVHPFGLAGFQDRCLAARPTFQIESARHRRADYVDEISNLDCALASIMTDAKMNRAVRSLDAKRIRK